MTRVGAAAAAHMFRERKEHRRSARITKKKKDEEKGNERILLLKVHTHAHTLSQSCVCRDIKDYTQQEERERRVRGLR